MRNRLKELRARDGLNQTQLAKQAGVSRQTISLIERNKLYAIGINCNKDCSYLQ